MRPPSAHSHFFSSLKQVEKRLKLDNPSQPYTLSSPPPPPPASAAESSQTLTESLSSPIYLNFDRPTITDHSIIQDNSEVPHEFLSNSSDFPPTHEDPPHSTNPENQEVIYEGKNSGVDDIQLLMQLLGSSDSQEDDEEKDDLVLNCGGCDDGFYGKIVGVKGPKCGKELERLEGWIKHFLNGSGEEGRREPLRLAHLLLGKAAFVSKESDGIGEFGFPSTVDEFLQDDPPRD
ncbi:unnamed protein product [Ilex paraguariensis]|uniref:Uncharacterized protein n=1 Tax=Ilex paraguariensis TaxID=185542 RepID=A0ABC8R380_9AQUA